MRWLIFFIPLSLIPFKGLEGEVSPIRNSSRIFESSIKMFKEDHKRFMLESIIYIESRGREDAYNASEGAVGVLQVRPIMLRHANLISGYERFKLEDRWCREKSIEIFWVVQEHHNPNMWLDQACHIWNAGISDRRRWHITQGYRDRVSLVYNKIRSGKILV